MNTIIVENARVLSTWRERYDELVRARIEQRLTNVGFIRSVMRGMTDISVAKTKTVIQRQLGNTSAQIGSSLEETMASYREEMLARDEASIESGVRQITDLAPFNRFRDACVEGFAREQTEVVEEFKKMISVIELVGTTEALTICAELLSECRRRSENANREWLRILEASCLFCSVRNNMMTAKEEDGQCEE